MLFVVLFFFSSRRRHTRYWRDWSSDVCSSDLAPAAFKGERREVDLESIAVAPKRIGMALGTGAVAQGELVVPRVGTKDACEREHRPILPPAGLGHERPRGALDDAHVPEARAVDRKLA